MASSDNAKIGLVGSEVSGITDAVAKVIEAIKPYEKPMFSGGPLPSAVLQHNSDILTAKLTDASQNLLGGAQTVVRT